MGLWLLGVSRPEASREPGILRRRLRSAELWSGRELTALGVSHTGAPWPAPPSRTGMMIIMMIMIIMIIMMIMIIATIIRQLIIVN